MNPKRALLPHDQPFHLSTSSLALAIPLFLTLEPHALVISPIHFYSSSRLFCSVARTSLRYYKYVVHPPLMIANEPPPS